MHNKKLIFVLAIILIIALTPFSHAQPTITGGVPFHAANGTAATIDENATFTGAAGTNADVTNIGTMNAALLDFTIPRGDTGAAGAPGAPGAPGAAGADATIDVNATFTGDPGTLANVTNIGTPTAALLDFFIPRGDTGIGGSGSDPDAMEYLFRNGSRTYTGSQSMGNFNLTNVTTVAPGDAVCKTYVDTAISSISLSDYFYKPGITGGQWANGGILPTDNLTLNGTISNTKTVGNIILNPNGGNVGIKTINPMSLFTINGTGSPVLAYFFTQSTGANAQTELQMYNGNSYLQEGIEGTTPSSRIGGSLPNSGYLGMYTNNNLTFHTNNKIRLSIRDNGYFDFISSGLAHGITNVLPTDDYGLIGKYDTHGSLYVAGANNADGSSPLWFDGVWGTTNPTDNIPAIRFNGAKKNGASTQSLGNAEMIFSVLNNQVSKFVVMGNGNTGLGTSDPDYQLELSTDSAGKPVSEHWTIVSDERLKEDVVPITTALSIIEQLSPKEFAYKNKTSSGTDRQFGFISQDVEKVIPQWVKMDSEGYKTITVTGDTALLVGAIQEQQQEIEDLEKRVSVLEGKVGK